MLWLELLWLLYWLILKWLLKPKLLLKINSNFLLIGNNLLELLSKSLLNRKSRWFNYLLRCCSGCQLLHKRLSDAHLRRLSKKLLLWNESLGLLLPERLLLNNGLLNSWLLLKYKLYLHKYWLHHHLIFCFFDVSFNWHIINLFFISRLGDVFNIILNSTVINILFFRWYRHVPFHFLILSDNTVIRDILYFGFSFDHFSSLRKYRLKKY